MHSIVLSFLNYAGNVTMVSLWPGPVKTEYVEENILTPGGFMAKPKSINMFQNSESVEFAGQAIAKLAQDVKRQGYQTGLFYSQMAIFGLLGQIMFGL